MGAVVLGRWRARRAGAQQVDHDRLRLVSAADWAITVARRVARPDHLARVMVEDVQLRADDDFGMVVSREDAAAALRDGLRLRVSYDIETDAFGTPSS